MICYCSVTKLCPNLCDPLDCQHGLYGISIQQEFNYLTPTHKFTSVHILHSKTKTDQLGSLGDVNVKEQDMNVNKKVLYKAE